MIIGPHSLCPYTWRKTGTVYFDARRYFAIVSLLIASNVECRYLMLENTDGSDSTKVSHRTKWFGCVSSTFGRYRRNVAFTFGRLGSEMLSRLKP